MSFKDRTCWVSSCVNSKPFTIGEWSLASISFAKVFIYSHTSARRHFERVLSRATLSGLWRWPSGILGTKYDKTATCMRTSRSGEFFGLRSTLYVLAFLMCCLIFLLSLIPHSCQMFVSLRNVKGTFFYLDAKSNPLLSMMMNSMRSRSVGLKRSGPTLILGLPAYVAGPNCVYPMGRRSALYGMS